MPGSDDQYDQVHTYSQDHAGKSKTTKPAVREIGRDGAPVQLYVGEVQDISAIRDPPSGVVYLVFDQADNHLKQKESGGTVTDLVAKKSAEQVQDDVGSIMNEPLDYDDATPAVDISTNTNRLAVSGGDLDVVNEGIQDIVGGMAGSNLTYDDANNVLDAAQEQNVPDWQADGTQTATGVTSDTYTLSGTYDMVLLHLGVTGPAGSGGNVDLRVNGDTGSNYQYIQADGTRTTGASEVTRFANLSADESTFEVAMLDGRWDTRWSGGKDPSDDTPDAAEGFSNTSITSPLDSVTIVSPLTISIEWQVYGRDVLTGGVP